MLNQMINDKRSLCDGELVWLTGNVGAYYFYDATHQIFTEAGCNEDEEQKTYDADYIFSEGSGIGVLVDGD